MILFFTRSIYVLTVWCVTFGVHFSLFLILKSTCLFDWFSVAIQVSSLKWARSLFSRKRFCKSEDNWFLLYLFKVGMKLRFLFRSLYVSKEHECFDEFLTFPDGSALYLSALVIIRCCLKVFALFLVRNSVPLKDRCWFEYGCFFWLEMFFPILSMFRLLLCRVLFGFVSTILIWFLRSSISLSLSVDVSFVVEETLIGDFGCVVYELDVVIPAFSRGLVVLLGCLFCLFFSNVELLDRWCWCLP